MRAAIFIDGAYFLSLMKKHDIMPRYEDLTDYLMKPLRKSTSLDLLRCYFYYCPPWMSPEPTDRELARMEEHDAFVSEIESLDRWAVRLGVLNRRWDGYKEYFEQKRVDVLLSVDMVRHAAAGHIQHVIVLAGDSDFIPAIDAVKDSGATVTIWYGDDNTIHKDLLDMADVAHQINWKKVPGKKIKNKKKDQKPANMKTKEREDPKAKQGKQGKQDKWRKHQRKRP